MNLKQEELEVIRRISDKLAPRYTFGIFDEDDIRQEIFLIAVKALPNFDEAKASLENFLFVHINNRLKTLIRDNHYTNNGSWVEEKKKVLINAVNIENVDENTERSVNVIIDESETLDRKIVFDLIDANLPSHLRADYLRLLYGNSIPTARKDKVIENISSILKENGYVD